MQLAAEAAEEAQDEQAKLEAAALNLFGAPGALAGVDGEGENESE
jgi:hypothetical protein